MSLIKDIMPGNEVGNYFKAMTSLVQDISSGRKSIAVHNTDDGVKLTVVPTKED